MPEDEKEFWEKVNERLYCSEKTIAELEKKIDNPILGDKIPEDARYEPGLKQQISELKQEQEAFIRLCELPCTDCKWNTYGEVLRDVLKEFEENHDESIHRDFFTKQLEKLDGEKSDFQRISEGFNSNEGIDHPSDDISGKVDTTLRRRNVGMREYMLTDSKPSEPKNTCSWCGEKFETWRDDLEYPHYIWCQKCFNNRKEPTEDVHLGELGLPQHFPMQAELPEGYSLVPNEELKCFLGLAKQYDNPWYLKLKEKYRDE